MSRIDRGALGSTEEPMASAPLLPLAPAGSYLAVIAQVPSALSAATDARPTLPTAEPGAGRQDVIARLITAHQRYVVDQIQVQNQFLGLQQRLWSQQPPGFQTVTAVEPVPRAEEGRSFTRQDLERLASGKISEVFGSLFSQQDGYRRQVRMPMPPLLLADRVTRLQGEPGSMGLGVICTETDVQPGAWYLHDGYMPAGIAAESGQADLLLISWLGIDFLNQGERVYRLLGGEITFHNRLPRPGETLRYRIEVDGHAQAGDARIFFFHYDCEVDGEPRVTMRNAQAGFFTDEELARSGGVVWTPEQEAPAPGGRVDSPHVACRYRSFTPEQVRAFAEGETATCFGPGFEKARTHTRTPRIQPGPMQMFDSVTHFDPAGGPWKRGYIRAERRLAGDEWFFPCHFKDDPVMPGTLMLEGCFQAMSFYLAALGYTLDRDGWRFEPVPDQPIAMICRGQVTPSSRQMVYEVFVEEVVAGPVPTLYAHVLVTVDGLKAFHGKRIGLRLTPDWPMTSLPVPPSHQKTGRSAAANGGVTFDEEAILASAIGQPSLALGERYREFDGHRRLFRLPGPPFLFVSRMTAVEGVPGRCEPGAAVTAEYDVPPDAWYFRANISPIMPFAVLLEASLQPCGWLIAHLGAPLTSEEDFYFRNLDGTAKITGEILPHAGTITTHARLQGVSRVGNTWIVTFQVESFQGGRSVLQMETVFGCFTADALANQPGLSSTAAERDLLAEPSAFSLDLGDQPDRYFTGTARLPQGELLMLGRITGYWPDGGRAGLGRLRAERKVSPDDWYFKAHFYRDPVQPGSLGLEAAVQLLQFYMLHQGMDHGLTNPRFEPLALSKPLSWKYRGQVLHHNERVILELEVTETGEDERGRYALADASLWVDGKRIYQMAGLGMRLVAGKEANS